MIGWRKSVLKVIIWRKSVLEGVWLEEVPLTVGRSVFSAVEASTDWR